MNTDLLLQLKREFQILVEQMKIVFCPQTDIPQHAYDLLQFKVPLQNLQNRLQTEKQNHINFGSLDQFQILWADEYTKQKWYQKKEQQEKLLEILLVHHHLLLSLCDYIRYHSHQKNIDLTTLLSHLIEFIAIDIRRYTHFPYLAIAYERIEALQSNIRQVIDHLKTELNPSEKQKQKKFYSLILDLEEYQSIIQPQAQLFLKEKADFEQQKKQWYQQQEELQHQQQVWLEAQKAELEAQKRALKEQEKALIPHPIETFAPVQSSASKFDKNNRNRQRMSWSPLLLLGVVTAILGGIQLLPKASVNSQQKMSVLAENQPHELRLKSAQTLAQEASLTVGNPPSSLTALKEAQRKWQDAIRVLEEMPDSLVNSEPVQEKLAIYQQDYQRVSQQLVQQQTAITNFTTARKKGLEASVLVKNPPNSLEVWQKAENQWQTAINLLETIPNDALIAPQVEEKLAFYRLNLQEIEKRIVMQQQADRE